MKFNKVILENINLAIKDFNEKGLPDGFGASAYFDVEIEGELYPPKPIMAYANYHATGENPKNNFSGGTDTPCFKAFERLGIPIIKKTGNMSSNAELYKQKDDYLKEWSIERLKTMTIKEYTNLEKTSFCYSLEHNTRNLGSIKGGSSYKFGIYRMAESSETQPANNRTNDGEYAWHLKYGETRDEAFKSIKLLINQIASFSQENRFKEIEEIDLGNAFKWKIAFLYNDFQLINVFKHSSLKISAEYLGYTDTDESYSALNEFIISKKGDQDFFQFAKGLWKVFGNRDGKRDLFEKWLKEQQSIDSGKNSSYLRAIDILENEFDIQVYNEEDILELKELYEDLIIDQKEESGKYFFSKAKSYGQGGFYSAAVGIFIEFLNQNPTDSKEEYALIALLKIFGSDVCEKYYELMSKVIDQMGVEQNDKRVHYTFRENRKRFGLTIGQKYAIMAEVKKGNLSFGYIDTINDPKNWWIEIDSIQELVDSEQIILSSADEEISKTNKTGYKKHSSNVLEKSIFNLNYRATIFEKAFSKTLNKSDMNTELNQIFFGPPGTGKTYHTINEAVKIADPDFYKKHKGDRSQLKERFKLLLINQDNDGTGQIGFTTFHQSFSYEDFVEGIKPMNPNESNHLQYHIAEGIFKQMCRKANDSLNAVDENVDNLISIDQHEFDLTQFYKMSLGNTQNQEDDEIYEYCIENGYVCIGFGDGLDFSDKDERQLRSFGQENGLESFPIQAMNLFCNYLKIGNYVVISNGNHYVRAIGVVTGDYEYFEESPFPNNTSWNHFRKVTWLFTNKNISAKEIYNKNFSQQSIYKLEKKGIKIEFFNRELNVSEDDLPKNPKNFVLIIDEINRGNVSSIFGELITLIEKDKRQGMDEELTVILPYSKTELTVPQNLFIIGTMNTADRSVEALDTALRRRFSFREMPPNPKLIANTGKLNKSNGIVENIDLVQILTVINDRIEKLIDKDHKIGHSYFLGVESESDLRNIFKDKVIPLLGEYFFGDFGKISLVLGSSFISKTTKENISFASSHEYDPSMAEDLLEKSVYEFLPVENWDFKSIYE